MKNTFKKCRHKYYIKYTVYCTKCNMDGGGNFVFNSHVASDPVVECSDIAQWPLWTLMLSVYTDRIQAALHHSRFRDQARYTACDKTLKDVNIRSVSLHVPLVWVCHTTHVVTYLHTEWNHQHSTSHAWQHHTTIYKLWHLFQNYNYYI